VVDLPPAETSPRRHGDEIAIPGDYQHRALLEGPSIQRYWHQSKLELLDWMFTPEPTDCVLDVGCGSGVFANQLASYGAEVLAIDGNADAIEYGTETFGNDRLKFRLGLLDELDLPENSFDRATCLEIVEHVFPDQIHALCAQLRRILRPGGSLLVTTPNYRGIWPLVEWASDHIGQAARMDADQHVTHFHRSMLRSFLTDAGFEIRALRTYCTFSPFVSALSWPVARRLDLIERRIDWPFGNLLVAVARNPVAVPRHAGSL